MRLSLLLLAATLGSGAGYAQAPDPRLGFGPAEAGTPPLLPTVPAARTAADVLVPRQTMVYFWDLNNQSWGQPQRRTTTYNAAAQPLQAVTVDSATQVPVSRVSYTYDAAGRMTYYLGEFWNGTAYANSAQASYTYDAQGRPTSVTSQLWTNGAWDNNSRALWTYDAAGNVLEYTSAQGINNIWKVSYGYQYSYTYTPAGYVQEAVYSPWNAQAEAFIRQGRTQYTYGTTPQWTSYVYQTWSNGSYFNTGQATNAVYDGQERLTSYDYQAWHSGLSAWQPYERITNVYGIGNSRVQTVEKYVQNAWTNRTRSSVGYDRNGRLTINTQETWANNVWVINLGNQNLWRYNAAGTVDQLVAKSVVMGAWVNQSKERYSNFQTITLAARPVARLQAAIDLYPNPAAADDELTLRVEGLREQAPVTAEVLNSLGQVVLTRRVRVQQGRIEQRLNVDQLPAGSYTVRLQTAEGVATKPLVRR